jgi:uncharacterized protein (DUF1786 family)
MPERLRVLAVDIGTGTQDVLLFDSIGTIENCFQLVLPSPTVIVAERIQRATQSGAPLLLTGRTMGGGPSAWAARDHALAGLPTYATPDAARTLDDDLAQVEQLGIRILPDEAAARLLADQTNAEVTHVIMRDFDSMALLTAFAAFGVDTAVDLVAVAAFDHGAAPPGYSDRRFRFDYIRRAVGERPEPVAFSYRAADVPADMTRLHAVARDAAGFAALGKAPVLVMDSAAAAVAGALDDPHVRALPEALLANIGNFHTLAFHLRDGRIRGLFEHHTGELTQAALERYLDRLVAGTLTDDEVFAESGHGALVLGEGADDAARPATTLPLAITGPRRALLRGSRWRPYEAVPHGAMMLAGCFGLLRAVALHHPELAPAVADSLGPPPRA